MAAKAVLTAGSPGETGAPADYDKDALIVNQISGPWFAYFLHVRPGAELQPHAGPDPCAQRQPRPQVPADDNFAAIRAATKGNPDVTIIKLPGLNHLFQHATTGGIGEYGTIEETWSPRGAADHRRLDQRPLRQTPTQALPGPG